MHRVTETPSDIDPATVRAWEELARRHSSGVFRLAYRLTGNRADAEDLTQEVLVRAMRTGPDPDLGASGAAEGWFHRVTTNLFVDMLRRRRRVGAVSIDERPWALEPVDDGADPATRALAQTLEPDLQAALATLPPLLREAVLLRDVHGLTYAEVATVLGVGPGTVRSRIHRGRARLRRALAHRAPGPGRVRHRGPREEPTPGRPPGSVAASGTMVR